MNESNQIYTVSCVRRETVGTRSSARCKQC